MVVWTKRLCSGVVDEDLFLRTFFFLESSKTQLHNHFIVMFLPQYYFLLLLKLAESTKSGQSILGCCFNLRLNLLLGLINAGQISKAAGEDGVREVTAKPIVISAMDLYH